MQPMFSAACRSSEVLKALLTLINSQAAKLNSVSARFLPIMPTMAFLTVPLITTRSSPQCRPRRPRYICATSPPQPKPETHPSEAYLRSLGLSPQDAKRCLARLPTLKSADLPSEASPTVTYLRETLHLNASQIARTIRNAPQILFLTREPHASRLHFLENEARIPNAQLAHTISKCPHILWMDLQNASQVVDTVIEACPSIPPTILGTIFRRVPQALLMTPNSLQHNMQQIRQAGVTNAQLMARICCKAPLSLVYSHQTLQKRLIYLQNVFNSPPIVGKVLAATPELLQWSVDKTLKPRITLLTSLVGSSHIASTFDKVPTLFSVPDILDRVLWLRDTIGLNDDEIRQVLRQAPAVLTYSILGNLTPKWTFIRETMGGSKDDIVQAPRETLCANLQQRAMPRYAFLASRGVKASVVETLRGNDHDFCKQVAQCDPSEFRQYVDNDTYLLFFSQLI